MSSGAINSPTMMPYYYHGEISRKDAENLVCNTGDFLLRYERGNRGLIPSSSDSFYVITICWNGKVLHAPIESRCDEKLQPFYFLEKIARTARSSSFNNVNALVDFLHRERVPLGEENAILITPIDKAQNIGKQVDSVSKSEQEKKTKLDRGRVATTAKRVAIRNVSLWETEQQLADYSDLENVLRQSSAIASKALHTANKPKPNPKPKFLATPIAGVGQQGVQTNRLLPPKMINPPTYKIPERAKSTEQLNGVDTSNTTVTHELPINKQSILILGVQEHRLLAAKPLDSVLINRLYNLFIESANIELLFDALSRSLASLFRDAFTTDSNESNLINLSAALRLVVNAESIRSLFTALLIMDGESNTSSSAMQSTPETSPNRKRVFVVKLVELLCLAVRRRVSGASEIDTQKTSIWCANQLLFITIGTVLYDTTLFELVVDCLNNTNDSSMGVTGRSTAAVDRRVTDRLRTFFLNDARVHFDAAIRFQCSGDRFTNILPYFLVMLLASSDVMLDPEGSIEIEKEVRKRLDLIQNWCQLDDIPIGNSLNSNDLLGYSVEILFLYEQVLSKSRHLIASARAQHAADVIHNKASSGSLPASVEGVLADANIMLLALFGASAQSQIRQRCLLREAEVDDVIFWFDACSRMNKILHTLKSRLTR